MLAKTLLLLLALLILTPVAEASAGINSDPISDTPRAVMERLKGETETPNNEPAYEEIEEEKAATNKTSAQTNQDAGAPSNSPSEDPHAASIPDHRKNSMLESMRQETRVYPHKITESVDSLGTSAYNLVSSTVISLAPIVLVIGALALLLTKGKAIGLLLIALLVIFAILSAPELIKMFLSFVMGIFQ